VPNYMKKEAKNGRTMYYRDGKLIKESEYVEPPQKPVFDATSGLGVEVKDLEGGIHKATLHETVVEHEEIVQDDVKETYIPPQDECIFCGANDEFQKLVFIDGTQYTVGLCSDDYYSKSLGKVVQKIKENSNESIVG